MSRPREEVDRFRVVDDDGYENVIIVYQEFIKSLAFGLPDESTAGLRVVQTADGLTCNRINDDEYEVVNDVEQSNRRVRRVPGPCGS